MGPEGMEKFCEDIGVEPENVGSLSPHCGFLLCWFEKSEGRKTSLGRGLTQATGGGGGDFTQ